MNVYRNHEEHPPYPSRLWATFYFAVGALDLTPHFLAQHIESVVDHKGQLEVTWLMSPPESWKDAFRKAWSVCGNEPPESVEHIVPGDDGTIPDDGGMVSLP